MRPLPRHIAILVVGLALLAGCSRPAPRVAGAPDGAIALTHARLVDPVARTVSMGTLIVGPAGVIARVGEVPPGFEGQVVDLAGRWLLPGLVDLHVHSWGNAAPLPVELRASRDEDLGTDVVARLVLRAGVTALLDLGGDEDARLAARAALRADVTRPHAELFVAGPVFVESVKRRRAGRGGARVVSGPADARRQVRELALRHPDVIKIIYDHTGSRSSMRRTTMRAVIAAARGLGLRTVVHIGSWRDAREAIEAGAAAITHLYDDEIIPESLARLYADRHVVSIPTMAVQCDLARLMAEPRLLEAPLLGRLVTPGLLAAYRDVTSYSARARSWARWQRDDCVSHDFVSLRRLEAAGVGLATGSDSGNFGVFEGYSVHRELALMVEAGVDRWTALASATTRAAAFLGLRYGFGPGDEATFVVLDGDPTVDIANTMRVQNVVLHGKFVF